MRRLAGFASVALAVLMLSTAGCAAGGRPLERPVVLGASLSSGAESYMEGGKGRVDLAGALDAVIEAPGGRRERFRPLADGALFLAPVEGLRRQADAALAARGTGVVALDALFWCVYGPARDEGERLHRLGEGLAVLEGCEGVPILLGDLPDARASVREMLGEGSLPEPATLAAAQERIAAWAAERSNVRLFPLRELHADVLAGRPLTVDGRALELSGAPLMTDALHATAEGQLVLAHCAAAAMRESGWLKEEEVILSLDAARERLLPRARQPPRRDRRADAAAALERLRRLEAARNDLSERLAAEDGEGAFAALLAVMDPSLAFERGMIELMFIESRIEPWSTASEPALRAARAAFLLRLAEQAKIAAFTARRAEASPEELATAIEWLLATGPPEAAIPFADRLGRLAHEERELRIEGAGASADRLADLLYATTKGSHPMIASALVVEPVEWARSVRAREAESASLRAVTRSRGIDLPAPRVDAVEELALLLEKSGRSEEAARVRAEVKAP